MALNVFVAWGFSCAFDCCKLVRRWQGIEGLLVRVAEPVVAQESTHVNLELIPLCTLGDDCCSCRDRLDSEDRLGLQQVLVGEQVV